MWESECRSSYCDYSDFASSFYTLGCICSDEVLNNGILNIEWVKYI